MGVPSGTDAFTWTCLEDLFGSGGSKDGAKNGLALKPMENQAYAAVRPVLLNVSRSEMTHLTQKPGRKGTVEDITIRQ